MPISTSQSLLVSLRFTLSHQVTECPYQLPRHCSSLSVLLSVHKSLNAHINFPVIVRLSLFYSQYTSHWMPISTSQSFFVSLRFTLSPQVTECSYNFQVIVLLSTFYSQSTSHWMPIPAFQSFFVFLRFTLSPQVTECHINFPVIVRLSTLYSQSTSHWMPTSTSQSCSSLSVLLSVHESLNAHINFPVNVRLSPFYSQSTSHWIPISTYQSLFVSLRFTLSPQVTECPYQLPRHCSSFSVLLSVHKSLNAHINFPVIVRLSKFYSQSTSHWMPISTSQSCSSLSVLLSVHKSLNTISTSQSLFVSLRFTLSPQVTECPYQLPSHCSSLYVLLSVNKSLNAHINFPAISRFSTFYSQSTSHWIPISTSQSLFVSLRFTLSPQVTECPYQLPSHLSSLYVLLSVNKSLNAHINFQVIVRLSPFYSESTSHGMPISTWQSLFVFLWFTLSTRVTECPYQLPSHFSSLYDLLWIHKSLNVHTTSRSLFFSLRFTLNPQVTEWPYQPSSHFSSLSVLLAVHESLNAHINFPVISHFSTFYSQSTSHWMPISTSQSFFVSLRFTLSPQVTECPYQLPSHYSSLYVLLSVHKSLNAHINFQVIFRLSTFYPQSTSHWMPISISKSLFVSLRFTLGQQVTECPYQLPSHFSSLSFLLSVHKSLNVHINCPVIVRLSLFYSQYTSHWMSIPTSQSFLVSLRFILTQ